MKPLMPNPPSPHAILIPLLALLLPALCAAQDNRPVVVVVEGDRLGEGAEYMRPQQQQYTRTMLAALDAARVPYSTTRDSLVERHGLPQAAKVAVLPYNRAVPPAALQHLLRFIGAGGKIIMCLLGPPELLAAIGVEAHGYLEGENVARFAALDFGEARLAGLPREVPGRPERVRVCGTRDAATVVGWWRLSDGARTDRPGVLVSSNGAFISSVLPEGGDRQAQGAMMRALCGHFAPEIWRGIIPMTAADIRPLGNYESLEHMRTAILERQRAGEDVTRALGAVQEVIAHLDRARHAFSVGDMQTAASSASLAEELARRAYWMSYPSRNGELRGVWASNTVFGDWPTAMATLREHNFNAVFPYVASAGVAWYRSNLLPRDSDRDWLTRASEAALRSGVPLHPRTLVLYAMCIPDAFRDRLRAEGRLMVSSAGKSTNWLCPVQPQNRRLVTQVAVEIVRDYPVAGFHLDYLRYPGINYCFCPTCKAEFQRYVGRTVPNMAEAVKSGEMRTRFLDWRREQLTTLMRDIRAAVRAARPEIPVSAAVFLNWEGHRDHFAQDWKVWVDRGLLDFVAPMNYTPNNERFAEWTQRQIGWIDGQVPLCPGIGVNADNMTFGGPQNLLDQITIARNLNTDGWVIFNYAENLVRDYLPYLRLGATSSPSSFNPFRRALMPEKGS